MYLYGGESLAQYGFGEGHPLGTDRLSAFWGAIEKSGLLSQLDIKDPTQGTAEDAALFHNLDYIARVRILSKIGKGLLDQDTPVFPGIFETALVVVGTVLDAVDNIIHNQTQQAFVPIAGLHHASRENAAGFCVFNDCGIAIEALRRRHGIRRILYVDIDAHHADGVFYAFEDDPELYFVDVHEDGNYLYPGTGSRKETGHGQAAGLKLNIPLLPGATDTDFDAIWPEVSSFIEQHKPEFILLQAGADSLAGDPITHMEYTHQVHYRTARYLSEYAHEHCGGKLIALGGGGYNRANIALAWTSVVRGMLDAC